MFDLSHRMIEFDLNSKISLVAVVEIKCNVPGKKQGHCDNLSETQMW